MTTLEGICLRWHLRQEDLTRTTSPISIPGATRNELPKLFRDLGFTVGAEIGVWSGRFSERLCGAIPNLRLYCVDPYLDYADYKDNKEKHLVLDRETHAKARLRAFSVTWLRQFSVDAAQSVPDGSLDFVYIDGNHELPFITADLAAWSRKVRPGGIISGHDYHTFERLDFCHVKEAVDAWTAAYRIHPWFLTGLEEEAALVGGPNRYRSFFWVNP